MTTKIKIVGLATIENSGYCPECQSPFYHNGFCRYCGNVGK